MLVIRPRAVVQDRVQRSEIARIRIEPGIDLLRLDRNDAVLANSQVPMQAATGRNRSSHPIDA